MNLRSSARWREKMEGTNTAEYEGQVEALSWVSPDRAREAEAERDRHLAAFSDDVGFDFKQTKPHSGPLAPGCRICGQGAWSCLFINGTCNCRCFYCPTSQDDVSVPTTNRLSFETPRDYADYVRYFNFKGVSISGGEPLLTFDRTLSYVEAVRREMGDAFHIWLYTNGTLVTPGRLRRLGAAGLNEIRIDISAVDYDLTGVRMASDVIPCVTVEIPAIPEDLEKLMQLLPVLQDAGVRHLNLHQLRLTPYNFARLSGRNYTYLHGEKVTVLESELAALAILANVSREGLTLPVNYCAYVYKRRYQQAATRRRNATHLLKGYESITENGFIRCLSLAGDSEVIGRQAERLERSGSDKHTWYLTGKKDCLFFHESLWQGMDFSTGKLRVSYSEAVLSPSVSYRCAFTEVRLNPSRSIYVERQPLLSNQPLEIADRAFFEKTLFQPADASQDPDPSTNEALVDFELIRSGLQDYF